MFSTGGKIIGSWPPRLTGGTEPVATAQLELGGEKGGESGACRRPGRTSSGRFGRCDDFIDMSACIKLS